MGARRPRLHDPDDVVVSFGGHAERGSRRVRHRDRHVRTSARLVVNPAKVVIDETRRSFAYLSLYGVATDAVLVNRLLPERAASGYFARWAEREREELISIEESFPVPLFRAPLLPHEPIGIEAAGSRK